jgi:hypothetical protein
LKYIVGQEKAAFLYKIIKYSWPRIFAGVDQEISYNYIICLISKHLSNERVKRKRKKSRYNISFIIILASVQKDRKRIVLIFLSIIISDQGPDPFYSVNLEALRKYIRENIKNFLDF